MNIQKSRITAILSVAIIACMMVTVMAVPAFAAEVEERAYYVDMEYNEEQEQLLHDLLCYDCEDYQYMDSAYAGYMMESGDALLRYADLEENFSCLLITEMPRFDIDGETYIIVPAGTVVYEDRDNIVTITREIPDETDPDASDSDLADLVNSETLSSVIDEILSLLPMIVPVIVVFIGLRKGISFVQNVLNNG